MTTRPGRALAIDADGRANLARFVASTNFDARPHAAVSLLIVHGISLPPGLMSNLELIVFGGLIIFFLIVEPHGLARLWQIGKEKLRLWPFPH